MASLIEAIENGNVPQVPFPYENSKETHLSKVFFHGDRAYKVYKKRKGHFGNLVDSTSRRTFLEDDKIWNTTLSPEVYLNYQGMRLVATTWRECPLDESDDVLIVMRRIETPNVTTLLQEHSIQLPALQEIITMLTLRADTLSSHLRARDNSLYNRKLQDLLLTWLDDVLPWAISAHPHINEEWSRRVIDALNAFVRRSEYLAEFPESSLTAALDSHADNIFFQNKPIFLDSMLPREDWRIADSFTNTAKFAVDVFAHYGTSPRDALYAAYAAHNLLPPKDEQLFYEAYYSFLKCIYNSLQGLQDSAEIYQDMVDKNLTLLK